MIKAGPFLALGNWARETADNRLTDRSTGPHYDNFHQHPPWVAETLQAMGRDPSAGLPAAKLAAAYVESVEGRRTGEVLDARRFG